jgi:hypothetical protein
VRDDAGRTWVVKWSRQPGTVSRFERAAEVTERLSSAGYPSPRYERTGAGEGYSFALQSLLPGATPRVAEDLPLGDVFRLSELQSGKGAGTDRWPRRVFDLPIRPLARSEAPADTWPVLEAAAAVLESSRGFEYRHGDVVHYDFNPANLLVARGCITGVVDWEGVCSGDRGFDIATLFYFCWTDARLREALRAHGAGISGPGQFDAYLGHMVLRQLTWSVQSHPPERVREVTALGAEIVRSLGRS